MMELNGKSPFLWDLENLVMFNSKEGEPPKTLQLVESEIEGIEAFELGSFYSSGGVSDGGTGSDLGYTSSSRSSKSGSDYSSTDRGIKETKFSLETNDCFQQDLGKKREFVQSIESSAVSGESLTALELCNRTYFEDTVKGSSVPSADFSVKKSKSSSMSLEVPRCQVEGCNVDLSSAKDYHRKHKVCETHSKCPRVVINGHERRFCQQCSRFHSISEFDHKKRSCRRRLSDHNARRRKPKPEIIQFNSMGMSSSLYEGGNQLNFGFDQAPMLQTRPGTWDSSRNSKHTLAKSGVVNSINGGSNGIMHYSHDGMQIPVTKVSPVSNHYVPSKGSPPEIYHRGLAASVAPTNMNTAQNLGALSLLSTSSWGSGNHNPSPLDHPIMHSNNPSVPAMHPVHPGGPPVSSEFWSPSFQLFKAPNESSFYLY